MKNIRWSSKTYNIHFIRMVIYHTELAVSLQQPCCLHRPVAATKKLAAGLMTAASGGKKDTEFKKGC